MPAYPGGRVGGKQPAPRHANVYVPPASLAPHPSLPHLGGGVRGGSVGGSRSVQRIPQRSTGAPPTHTDVTSGGYNVAANAYKQTPQYKQAIQQVFRAQPAAQKASIIAGLMHHQNPWSLPELHAVRSVWDHLPTQETMHVASLIPHDIGAFISPHTGSLGSLLSGAAKGAGRLLEGIHVPGTSPTGQSIAQSAESRALGGGPLLSGLHVGKGISGVLGAVEQGLNAIQPQQRNQLQSQAGISAGGLGRVVTHTPINVARAAAEKPSVLPATAKGLGETALGAIPGIIEAAQHPGKTIQAMAHDYSQRYGPVAAGNDRAAINRIKASSQGAAPEALDTLGMVAGADATLGRAATGLAKTREALTGKPNFLTRERPALRVAGGTTREQKLAHGAGKITAQRTEDAIRRALAHKNEIQPRAHEVVPVFGRRAQKITASRVVSRNRELLQQMRQRLAVGRKGAQGVYNRLGKWEKKAFVFAHEGGIPLHSGPQVAREWIDRHIAIIEHDRATNPESFGNRIAPQHRGAIDDLGKLKELRANVDKWLTPKLSRAVDAAGTIRKRTDQLAVEGGAIHPATAEARAVRVQGELLGFEHPNERIAREVGQLEQHARELKQREAQLLERPKESLAGNGYQPVTESGAAHMVTLRRVGMKSDTQALAELRATRAELKNVQDSIKILSHDEGRHALLGGYAKDVRAAAAKEGLPAEPGYLLHQPHPKIDFGAHTTGTGHHTMPEVQASHFSLWRGGAVDRSAEAYVNGVARSIKRPFQWKLVDEQAKASTLPPPSMDSIHAALGKEKRADQLTLWELKQAMAHEGVKMDRVMFYRPGKLKASSVTEFQRQSLEAGSGTGSAATPAELETNAELAHAFEQDNVVQPGKGEIPPQYRDQTGWRALPRAAYDEIHSSLQPSGRMGRVFGKMQGLNAIAILGGSPSFAVMNSLADAIVATIGTRGKILKDALDYPLWFHRLTDEQRDLFKATSGGRAHFRPERLGSTARSGLVRGWRELRQRGLFRVARAANPIRALFKGQAEFSDFMRHVVQFSEMKRTALENMGREMGQATRALETAHQMFRFGPTRQVEQQLTDMLQSVPAMERVGEHTVSYLGDYTRFTSLERKYLNNRAILFYSFLRYATRTLFYTLPLHHPIVTALVGELSKLHGDEVRKLLGGQDLPWAYSRLFFDRNGKLASIDTMRFSPVGSVGTDIATRGIQGISQTIFPEAQILLNQIYGTQPTGAPYPRGVFSALNDLLSMSYPYRAASQLHFGLQPQRADSIPFLHERADVKKSASAQAYQQAKIAASGPLKDKMLSGLLGVFPKPDNSRVVAQHMAQKAKKGGGGSGGVGGLFGGSSGDGGGVGGLFGGASNTGGAEGMRRSQGGALANAIQGTGAAAVNAINATAGQVGQLQTPAATGKSPFVGANGNPTQAQLRRDAAAAWARAQANGKPPKAAPAQIHIQQLGNAKLVRQALAKAIDPNVPLGFLQKQPAFARVKGNGLTSGMKAVIGMANAITSHHYNYQWAGGHTAIGQPTGGPGPGFDCSGAVSAILHAAGVLQTPLVSGQMMSLGQPGPGTGKNDVTIYASPSHVVAQFPGGRFFGTSSAHNPGGGADWFTASPSDYPTSAGYAIRHVTISGSTTPQHVQAQIPQAAHWMVSMLPKKVQASLAKQYGRAQATGKAAPTGGVQVVGGRSPALNAPGFSAQQKAFGGALVKASGLDPAVVAGWLQMEEPIGNAQNTDPANHGSQNWLNIGITGSGNYGAQDPAWRNPVSAGKATAAWLMGKWAPAGYGHAAPSIQNIIPSSRGKGVAAQVAAIANSHWAGSGYPGLAAAVSKFAGVNVAGTVNVPTTSLNLGSGGGGASGGGSGAVSSVGGSGGGGSPAETLTGALATRMLGASAGANGQTLSDQAIQQLLAQQSTSQLLSGYLKGASPWDIGPSSSAFGGSGNVNLGALGMSPGSLSALPALPTSRKKVKL